MTPRWILLVAAALTLGASVSAHVATIQITMENLVISLAEASAKIGDTIEWINKDVFAHPAAARNGDWDVTLPLEKTGCHCRKLNQASKWKSNRAMLLWRGCHADRNFLASLHMALILCCRRTL